MNQIKIQTIDLIQIASAAEKWFDNQAIYGNEEEMLRISYEAMRLKRQLRTKFMNEEGKTTLINVKEL